MSTTRSNRLIVALEVFLAAMLTSRLLGAKSLWVDEVYSIVIARDWTSMWEAISQNEANMTLYYVLLHFWLKLGESEFLTRSLSSLFAVATVPVVYALGAHLFGSRAGRIGALLLAVNACFIQYAQEARSYSLLMLLSTLSSYFFVKSVERPLPRLWLGYVITSVLAIYTHFFGALVPIAHVGSLAFLRRRDIPWSGIGVSSAAMLLLLSPLGLILHMQSQMDWMRPPGARDVANLFLFLAGGLDHLRIMYFVLCLAALSCAVTRSVRLRTTVETWRYAFVVVWLLAPIAISVSFSVLVKPVFVERYLIFCLPPFVLLVSVGLSNIGRRWLFAAALAVTLMLSGNALLAWYSGRTASAKKEDWRGATAFVLSRTQPGDAVLFYAYFVRKPFEYYLGRLKPPNGAPEIVELASAPYVPGGRLPPPNRELLGTLPRGHPRVWLILSHHEIRHLDRDVQTRLIRSLLNDHYTAVQERKFVGIHVVLYTG